MSVLFESICIAMVMTFGPNVHAMCKFDKIIYARYVLYMSANLFFTKTLLRVCLLEILKRENTPRYIRFSTDGTFKITFKNIT